MHQSIMTKAKIYASEDWVVLDVIIKHSIKFFSVSISRHNSIDKWREKQPSRGVLSKRCSKNMQQIYRRTHMPKCDFNKITNQLY